MNVGSLFSGIGGIDLGLERAGMRVVWQCESDPYCRAVLRKHWPSIPVYEDVQTLVSPDRVDLLAGGFPCQDVSFAGRRAGIGGKRSGLWTEFARLILELRPRYIFVENVPGLLVRGMGRVLGDLAACGYDAEWDCLPAAAFGAPHLRARIFILAYSDCGQRLGSDNTVFAGRRSVTGSSSPHTNGHLENRRSVGEQVGRSGLESKGSEGPFPGGTQWRVEPGVGRVANGVPDRVDRVQSLGNAVVPQISEYIGRRILEAEAACLEA